MIKGVYKITNIANEKIYIGSSKNILSRWNSHIRDLNNNKHHSWKLQKDWNSFGIESFNFQIIEVINDKDKRLNREQYWMNYYDAYNDFNYNVSISSQRRKIKNQIFLPNEIIETNHKLNLMQQRIIYFSMIKFQNNLKTTINKDFNYNIKINVLDFKTFFNIKSNNIYNQIKLNINKMKNQKLLSKNENNIQIFNNCFYDNINKTINIEFNKYIINKFLKCDRCFTIITIDNILKKAKCKYTLKLYELCCQYKIIKKREFQLEEILFYFNLLDKYSTYSNFKNKVLLKAINEINKYSNLRIKLKEDANKRNRKIEKIKLSFSYDVI